MYKRLDWDSEFWNMEIFSAQVEALGEIKKIIAEIRARQENFTCYFFSKKKYVQPKINGIELFDRKITFWKQPNPVSSKKISEVTAFTGVPHPKFIELAISSGAYSRFKKDKILSGKFEEFYTLWLLNSINGKMADKVLVYKIDGQIAGFVTLKFKDICAQIGIIAVDAEHRGKNIGSKLIEEAERLTAETGKNLLRVVTQGDNMNAMRFYEKNNFSIEKTEYIYHYHSHG